MRTSVLWMFLLQIIFLPCLGNVVINEISPWGSLEWIEFYNTGEESINLSDWMIETPTSMKDATLPENATIPAKGFFTIGDPNSSSDYEETITITDTAVFVALRNKENQTVDSVNLSNSFSKEENKSIQRISPELNLSNDSKNWIVSAPTKGMENFPESAVLEISQISGPAEIFANETVLVNVSVLNKGNASAANRTLSLNSSSGYSNSSVFDIGGLSMENISFEWVPESPGNITFCAFVDNSSLCREFLVLQKPEKLAALSIVLNDPLMMGKEYTTIFKIEIENKSEIEGSCEKKDNVTVSYNISDSPGLYNFSDSFTSEVGCSKTSGNGKWTPQVSGNFTLCGRIINSTSKFNDTEICQTLHVRSPEEIPCNLTLKLESKTSLSSGENSEFNITVNETLGNCPDCPVEITYSVENLSGSFILGYPKITNKTINAKNTFSFTPNLNCGTSVYKMKANISRAFCNDSFSEDNSAEVLINITGAAEKCEEPKSGTTEKSKKKTSTSSGGGGSVSSSNSGSGTISPKIIYLKNEVAAGEEFVSEVSIKNNGKNQSLIKVYSYAYDGKTCITGSWTENQIEFLLNAGETKELSLKNKIEEETKPGEYIFRVRAKLGSENFDSDAKIIVTDEAIPGLDYALAEESSAGETKSGGPELKIWNDTKLRINLTNCQGCEMIILGPNVNVTTDKKYRVFENKGTYSVIVMRNGAVVLNKTYDFTTASLTPSPKNPAEEESNAIDRNEASVGEVPTGKFSEVKESKGFFNWFVSFLKNLFSPILGMMDSSIAK